MRRDLRVVWIPLVAGAVACHCGCTDRTRVDNSAIPENILEIEQRVEVAPSDATGKLDIDTLKPDDIIVAVNGYPLTKKAFDDIVRMKAISVMREKGMNQLVGQKIVEDFRVNYPRTFIGQRLMIDNAMDLGVITKESVRKHVKGKVEELCSKRGKQVGDILKGFPGDKKYFFYELGASFAEGELIEKKIPPKFIVNDDFVTNVQHQVELENAAMAKTNELLKARLADWRVQILEKKLDFEKVAAKYSVDSPNSDEADGFWGEFEEQGMDDPGVAAAVFALPKAGAISEVLEDDNGYHLVKVLSIIPAERNDNGRIVVNERRRLSHIYFEKFPIIIRQTNKEMFKDLQMQMQMRAVNEYVANLQTNSTYKVVYPHGVLDYR